MKKSFALALGIAVALMLAALSAAAQSRPPRASVTVRSTSKPRVGVVGHTFVPGFGFRPIIREQFPVFGLGFDAHHFHVLHRRRRGFTGFHPGFFGGFRGRRGFDFVSFPFFPLVSSSSTVVMVPQLVPVQVPVQVPVIMLEESRASESVVVAGLPYNWEKLRVAESSYPRERPRLPQLTLLVLKDQTIIPVIDYWLEDVYVFYLTSTGRQDAFAVRELDWEMTTRLNAERNVTFALRSPR